MFTARYALGPYIKQIHSVFKGRIYITEIGICQARYTSSRFSLLLTIDQFRKTCYLIHDYIIFSRDLTSVLYIFFPGIFFAFATLFHKSYTILYSLIFVGRYEVLLVYSNQAIRQECPSSLLRGETGQMATSY